MRKCCALRATMILISFYSVLAGRRPARMHRENSGRSGGIGASARSDRAKSGVFRDRSASAGVVTRYFSLCLIFWCFWIKPKAQKKKCTTEEIDSYFGKYPAPPIGRFLRGADLPPFVTKRWRQKCSQGTSVGIGRRCSLSGHKRLRCCGVKRLHRFDCGGSAKSASGLCTRLLPVVLHARSGRSNLRPICFLLRCNAESMVRSAQHDLFRCNSSILNLAGLRPAGSLSEKSG